MKLFVLILIAVSMTTFSVRSSQGKESNPLQILKPPMLEAAGVEFTYGKLSQFTYRGATDRIERTIYVYVPSSAQKRIDAGEKLPALIYLHGGGASTSTVQGAQSVARSYAAMLTAYSEKAEKIMILPTSHIGWASHTRYFLADFVPELPSLLPVLGNRLVLAGHSMGGMGIAREFAYIHHLFAGVIAEAAGPTPIHATEFFIQTYFNTPYVHINGKDDHFREFNPRVKALMVNLTALETKLGRKSAFEYILREGGHHPDASVSEAQYERMFALERDDARKEFFFALEARNNPEGEHPILSAATKKAFWVELENYTIPEQGYATAAMRFSVNGQDIQIETLPRLPTSPEFWIQSVKLHLTEKLVDLRRPVNVFVNGKAVHSGVVQAGPLSVQLH